MKRMPFRRDEEQLDLFAGMQLPPPVARPDSLSHESHSHSTPSPLPCKRKIKREQLSLLPL